MKLHLITLAASVALACSCKKQEDKAAEPGTTHSGSATSGAVAAAPTENATDHVTVLGHHTNPKPTDPVHINFEKFKVVNANFDPKKIEGGTATIELDLSSFHTSSDERDNHLKSSAYMDVGKFATATITVDNVKKKAGSTYTADATVAAHGATQKYPVTFDVIDTADDHIRVKAEHKFMRLDFGIGTDPAQNSDEQVGTDLTIQMVLTLKK
jgi:polyisoprenoid-binding protein YceI